MLVSSLKEPSEIAQLRLPPLSTRENRREEVIMARTASSGKRTRIKILDIVLIIGGVVGIMAYNRMSLARLQHSLPNANSQIVGEWQSTRGPEHLVFRADKTISMTSAPAPAPNPAPNKAVAPEAQAEGSALAAPGSGALAPAAPEIAAPVVGNYKLSEAGRVFLQLSNGKKYSTTIQPSNKNRFDLIDSDTDGVTTFERVP
jgi:hypothetical protein